MRRTSTLAAILIAMCAMNALAQNGPGEQTYRLTVTASDSSTGNSIPGATVTLDQYGTQIAQGTVPFSWSFSAVGSLQGALSVTVQASGYFPHSQSVSFVEGGQGDIWIATVNASLLPNESTQIQQTLNHVSSQLSSAGVTQQQVQTFLGQVETEANTEVTDAVTSAENGAGNSAAAQNLSKNEGLIQAAAFQYVFSQTNVIQAVSTGDPVVVATGALRDGQDDISFTFHGHRIEVGRIYQSDRSTWSSFGVAWSFTYDTRVISGDDPGLDQMAQNLETSAAQLLSTYNQDNTEYTNLLASLQAQLSQAQSADTAAASAIASAQQTLTEIASSRDPSYYASFQAQAEQDLDQAETTKQQLDASVASLQQQIAALASVPSNLQSLQNAYDQVLAEATTVANEDKVAQADRSRNQYVLHPQDPSTYRTAGISTVTWIDEQGVPHEYAIQTAPDYATTAAYADGSPNFYPSGAALSPATPHDDPLALLPDGTFILTKKDQTKYYYDFYGLLSRIVDTNGNTVRMVYDANHQLTDVVDDFGRDLKLERTNGFITSATDPVGRTFQYGYDASSEFTSVTDPLGNTTRYGYAGGVLTEIDRPDGSKRTYTYGEFDGKQVVTNTTDEEGANSIGRRNNSLMRSCDGNERAKAGGCSRQPGTDAVAGSTARVAAGTSTAVLGCDSPRADD